MLCYYSSGKGRVQRQQKSAARLAAACSRKLRQTRAAAAVAVGLAWGAAAEGVPSALV